MKKIFSLLAAFLMVIMVFGKPVTMESARMVADNFYKNGSRLKNLNISDAFSKSFKGITTYYVFNYSGGGFVVVAADDAVIPILAESNTGYFDSEINNPSVKYWFDGYNKQITDIIAANYDNTLTLQEWNKIQANDIKSSPNDVGPLLTTTWDQGCYYNALCPVDATAGSGSCGHVWTGCVATTMSQLAKYYSFPAHGYLSHSYLHPTYGQQTANFATTNYNWSVMPNNVTSANANVATFMYQAGVSVDMDYGAVGSGAHSEDVPWALVNYFNFDPSLISFQIESKYTSTEWSNMLKAELDASRPMYYSGNDDSVGHAWVCDGYRSSDGKFHMNWGWSGTYNGYFAIGSLNPGGYQPNQNNAVIIGIKPGNPNLVARITNISNNTTLFIDAAVPIDVSVVEGTATTVKLFVDNTEIYTTSQATFTYNWSTTGTSPGAHILKVVAMNASDTVYFPLNISVNNWIPQVSGFSAASRGIKFIHAVDSLVVWATAYDGTSNTNYIQEFTRTTNGGELWTPGIINNCAGLEPSMIFALNADTAYCPMYKQTGSKPQGIYVTRNGGLTWTRQTSASFSNTASFPDVVHFFNKNEGWCMGDPINGEFECYTTANGGNTWTVVPAANLPNPLSGEFGIVGYVSAVSNNVWFGTNLGRVYRSNDKGLTWNVSTTTIAGKYIDVEFATALHGIAQDKDASTIGAMSETFDGGITWHAIASTGPVLTNDYIFVPGTENTWVSTGVGTGAAGASYSFDGGHSWQLFKGTELTPYLSTDWVNDHTGWAGGFSVSSTEGGMYKFPEILQPTAPMVIPENVQVLITGSDVMVSWQIPVTISSVIGYYVYRDGVLLTNTPTTDLFYNDVAPGNRNFSYCVSALYSNGESARVCATATLSIDDTEQPNQQVRVYPNPSLGLLNIDSKTPFTSVQIFNFAGQVVYSNNFSSHHMQIITSSFEAGVYLVRVQTKEGLTTRKILVK